MLQFLVGAAVLHAPQTAQLDLDVKIKEDAVAHDKAIYLAVLKKINEKRW